MNVYQQVKKVKQTALEEMRAKVAAWPSKKIEWAESDVLNAVEAQEKRLANVSIVLLVDTFFRWRGERANLFIVHIFLNVLLVLTNTIKQSFIVFGFNTVVL